MAGLPKLKPWEWGIVAIGGLGVTYIVIKRSQSSAASPSTAIDPVTGLPASQDQQVDPITGMTYLAEAQEYGSVTAAEDALTASGGGNSASMTDLGTNGQAYSYSNPPGVYGTNAEWAQAAQTGLTDVGYTGTDISGALGAYLSNLPLTAAQAQIVQAAIAEYGPPPVGSFVLHLAPSAATHPSPTLVTVPATIGLSAGEAHNMIVAAGLIPTAAPGQTPWMRVAYTRPLPGSQVPKGSRVTIQTYGWMPGHTPSKRKG